MTTTAVALAAGNPRLAFVVSVDGYPFLSSNAQQTLVQAAWAGTDWATKTVIPNLQIDLDNHQQMHPWQPFQGGGTLKLRIAPDDTDQLGSDIAKSDAGTQTMLTATALRTTVAIQVETGDGFTASDLHLGTECFGQRLFSGGAFYSAAVPTGAVFTYADAIAAGFKRGKYTAVSAYSQQSSITGIANSDAFAEHHRVTTADNGVRLAPIVSEQPRTWHGRRVRLWLHIYEAGSLTLNTKAEALCIFSGFLEEAHDSQDGATEITCSHLLDRIKSTTLGRDMFECTVGGGHYVKAGLRFKFLDHNGVSYRTANDLVVVASGAVGTNQINAGVYSIEEIAAFINAWLAGEVALSRVWGNYTLSSPENVDGNARTVMHFYVPASSSNVQVYWSLTWPFTDWGKVLGISGGAWSHFDSGATGHAWPGDGAPQPVTVFSQDLEYSWQALIENQTGTFQDQYSTLPAAIKASLGSAGATKQWGLFLFEIDTPVLCVGRVETPASGAIIRQLYAVKSPVAPIDIDKGTQDLKSLQVKLGEQPPRVRQIFIHEGPFRDVYRWLFYSTGTRGYNHPTHDVLPYGQGLAIPYGELGDNFEDSLDALPGAGDTILLTIDKPKRFDEACSADIKLRNAHLVWRSGGLRWSQWTTPTADTALVSLTDDTKAELADNDQPNHRSPWVLDPSWVKNIIKLQYDRDITKIAEGGSSTYRSPPIIIEDATSVDDQGGLATTFTLDCVNVYSEYDGYGQGIRARAAGLASWMPYWSRPIRKLHRSIDMRFYEGQLGVGDVVLVTDPTVRNPTDGKRGIAARPGLVIRHRYMIQTAAPPEKMKLAGEVDIVLLGNDRTYAYAPVAEFDFSYNIGGYTHGYDGAMSIHTTSHDHSESGEVVDSLRFAIGDKVKIVAVDPPDPDNPQIWDRTLNNVATDVLTIDSALGGWDSSARYRVLYDSYSDTQASQRSKAFQAASNGLIAPSVYPSLYGSPPNFTFLVASGGRKPTKLPGLSTPELPATISYGPNMGAPRDCAYDKELGVLLENIMDYGVNRSTPLLDATERSNSTHQTGWQLEQCRLIFLGNTLYGGGWNRWLWVRPLWRSLALAGSFFCSLRVTLSGRPPTGASRNDVTFNAPAVSNTWQIGNGDTAARIDQEYAFPLVNFNYFQYAFLCVECGYGAATRGLAQVVMKERVPL